MIRITERICALMGKTKSMRNLWTVILVCLLSVLTAGAVSGQAILTPTPDPDGNIFYIIKNNDSCMSISLTMGIDLQTLRQLNNLDEECTLIVGTRLLLGRYETPTPTPGPSPTPTPITPTPTPYNGYGQVCIYLFEDENGDGIVGEYEYGITGGAVSITKRTGSDNFTGLTAGNDLLCFNEVPEGEYNISIAPPTDYNPTTNMNYALTVKAGDNTQINFGAQKNSQLEEAEIQVDTTPKSPLLAMAGAALILGGLIIVFIFGVLKRNDQL